MGVLPPGTALDAGMNRRLKELHDLVLAATYKLMGLSYELQDPRSVRYVRARVAESLDILGGLWRLHADGTPAGDLVAWAREHIPATYGAGVAAGMRDLGVQIARPTIGAGQIHMRAVESLLDRWNREVQQGLIVPLKSSLARTVRIGMDAANFSQDIAAGILGGLPRTETSALLRRTLVKAINEHIPPGAVADLTQIEVGKRMMSADTWSEMLARTETARASTAGTRVLSEQNGVLHVQITTHAHAPCICTPFEGRIFRIYEDRGDPRFDWIGTVPNGGVPLHPNCVHREAPAVVEYLEERGDVAGRERPPADFRGLDEKELARRVRQHAGELRRYSEARDGMLPQGFRVRRAA